MPSTPVIYSSKLESVRPTLRLTYNNVLRRQILLPCLLSIALCVGASVSLYSAYSAVFLDEAIYANADRLYHLQKTAVDGRAVPITVSEIERLRERSVTAERWAALGSPRKRTLTSSSNPVSVFLRPVSIDFFSIVAVQPAIGRIFLQTDFENDSSLVAIISHSIWRNQFESSPDIVGVSVNINDRLYEIVGVMSERFYFSGPAIDVWVPRATFGHQDTDHTDLVFLAKSVATPEDIQQDCDQLSAVLRDTPSAMFDESEWKLSATLVREQSVGQYRVAFSLLLTCTALIILIGLTNVSCALCVGVIRRRLELATMIALGASRARVAIMLYTESAILFSVGGLAGLVLAHILNETVRLSLSEWTFIPSVEYLSLDTLLILWTFLGVFTMSIVVSIVPIIVGSRSRPSMRALSDYRYRNSHWLSAFQVLETVLAVVLVQSSLLIGLSLWKLTNIDTGIVTENIWVAEVPTNEPLGWSKPVTKQRYTDVLREIRALPGIRAATFATGSPPLGGSIAFLPVQFKERPSDFVPLETRVVGNDYFDLLELNLLRGRDFNSHDNENSVRVAVTNKSMAMQRYGTLDIVGKQFAVFRDIAARRFTTVVGVVEDIGFGEFGDNNRPVVYLPLDQSFAPVAGAVYLYQSHGNVQGQVESIRRTISNHSPTQVIERIEPFDALIARRFGDYRANLFVMAAFAILAIILMAVGVYGVSSHDISRREHENGVRMALGASDRTVRWNSIRRTVTLAFVGIVVGWTLFSAAVDVIESMLYGAPEVGWREYIGTATFVTFVTIVAAYVSSRRISSQSTTMLLKTEHQ